MELSNLLLNGKPLSISNKDATERLSVESRLAGKTGLTCRYCRNLVYLKSNKSGVFAAHYSEARNAKHIEDNNLDIQTLNLADCPYYSDNNNTKKRDIYKGEGEIHRRFKRKLINTLSITYKATDVTGEKFFRTHQKGRWATGKYADVYAEINGVKTAFEIQRAWMTTEDIESRETFYYQQGVGLVWIFCDVLGEFYTENGELTSYVNRSSLAVVSRIKNGSYAQAYNMGATIIYAREAAHDQLSFDANIQPFIKYENKTYIDTDSFTCPDISLSRLRYMEHSPLPTLWGAHTPEALLKDLREKAQENRLYCERIIEGIIVDNKFSNKRIDIINKAFNPHIESDITLKLKLNFFNKFIKEKNKTWAKEKINTKAESQLNSLPELTRE